MLHSTHAFLDNNSKIKKIVSTNKPEYYQNIQNQALLASQDKKIDGLRGKFEHIFEFASSPHQVRCLHSQVRGLGLGYCHEKALFVLKELMFHIPIHTTLKTYATVVLATGLFHSFLAITTKPLKAIKKIDDLDMSSSIIVDPWMEDIYPTWTALRSSWGDVRTLSDEKKRYRDGIEKSTLIQKSESFVVYL